MRRCVSLLTRSIGLSDPSAAENADRLSALLHRLSEEKELPYLDLRVYQGYEPVYHFLHGDADGSEFLQMYSMSKAVTVVAAMMLIEQGRLSLTDPIEKYFPEMAHTTYQCDGKVQTNPNRMTVWHLLTMTSGMSYDVKTKQIRDVTLRKGRTAVLQDYVPAFAATPLDFPTGEAFQYSLSHDLLAAVVEQVAGMPFDVFVKTAIFEPLEMDTSTFRNVQEGLYPMYLCEEDQTVHSTDNRNSLLLSENYISGGAGMVTTLGDYAKLIKALTNGGTAENGYVLLQEESVRKIAEPVLDRAFVKNSLDWLSDDYAYGLGVRVRTCDTEWGLQKGEFGWDGAAGSFWLADPAHKISIVMGMNILSWERKYMGIHMEITEMIYRTLFC